MQRIGQSTRQGGQASINLERFMEALHHSCTNLNYPALTGAQKTVYPRCGETFQQGDGNLYGAEGIFGRG